MVEGLSDQILLTSLTSLLRHHKVARPRLVDLNETTIVPAGSAAGVPYMAYLARGRDELKPACVALLDGDDEGRKAVDRIVGGDGVKRKPILDRRYVLRMDEWSEQVALKTPEQGRVVEPEDLIPPSIAAEAARAYAGAMLRSTPEEADQLTEASLVEALGTVDGRMWHAIAAEFDRVFGGAHIEKAGFAKEVALLVEGRRDTSPRPAGFEALEHNFGELIAKLAELLTEAEAAEVAQRTNRRSDRIVRAFLADYPDGVARDTALEALHEVESSLENTAGDDAVRAAIGQMRRRFELDKDPLEPVPDFNEFRQKLSDLAVIRRQAYRVAPSAGPVERSAGSD